MARNGKTPSRAKVPARPSAKAPSWIVLLEDLFLAAKGMGSNSTSLTLVAVLALVAVIAGQNAFVVLGFALFVMLALPIMRHFKLID